MAQYGFGSGTLFGFRTDIANPTPVQFGALQDVSIDLAYSLKELYGQYQFPLAVARSTAKVTGKAKFAKIQGRSFNDLFFGGTLTTGQKVSALNEGPTAIPTTPFQITVANSATFVEDLGVVNAATGIPFTRVASAPAAGQYSVAAGVYTFASADNVSAISVQISYTYTISGSGQKSTIVNQLLGAAPIFKAVLYAPYQSKVFQLELNQCISTKLSFATKLEDFIVPEIDFSAFVDSAGNLGAWSVNEAS